MVDHRNIDVTLELLQTTHLTYHRAMTWIFWILVLMTKCRYNQIEASACCVHLDSVMIFLHSTYQQPFSFIPNMTPITTMYLPFVTVMTQFL